MDGKSNGRHDIEVEDNPYTVGSRRRKKEAMVSQVVEEQKEDGPPVEAEKKTSRRRLPLLTALACAGLLCLGVVLYLALHRSTRIDHTVEAQPNSSQVPEAGQGMMQKAIKEAHEETNNATAQATPAPSPIPEMQAPPPSASTTNMGGTVKPARSAGIQRSNVTSVDREPAEVKESRAGAIPSPSPTPVAVTPTATPQSDPSPTPLTAPDSSHRATDPIKPLPTFGTMLPIRTMGAIDTLRMGTLTRLELTLDIMGKDWKLPQGTVFVAQTRGDEYDRLYLQVIGLLDPASGGLIKINGDVLGLDGSSGLKGKRHRFSPRTPRILKGVGRGGLQLTQSLLSGLRGGTTVIVPGLQPLESDLTITPQRRQFVEVPAGTMGYVLVNDLPREVKP